MDVVARRLGIDPLELRRRNVVEASDLPYTTAAGMVYDQVSIGGDARAGRRDDRLRRVPRRAGRGPRARAVCSASASACTSSRPASPWAAWRARAPIVRVGVNGQVQVADEQRQPRPEPRDDHRPGRRRPARRRHRRRHRRPGRHRVGAVRPGHRRQPQRGDPCSGAARRGGRARCAAKVLEIAAHAPRGGARGPRDRATARSPWSARRPEATSLAEVARLAYLNPAALPPGMEMGLEAKARYTPIGAVHVVQLVPRLHLRGRPRSRAR